MSSGMIGIGCINYHESSISDGSGENLLQQKFPENGSSSVYIAALGETIWLRPFSLTVNMWYFETRLVESIKIINDFLPKNNFSVLFAKALLQP